MAVEVVPAQQEHTKPIAMLMRKEDRDECKIFGNCSPIRAINSSYRLSLIAWTALEDGEPIAMFGACDQALLSDKGFVWFLGTNRVKAHARELIKGARFYIDQMLEHFVYLSNVIHRDNRLAVRFAQKLSQLHPDVVETREIDKGVEIVIKRVMV